MMTYYAMFKGIHLLQVHMSEHVRNPYLSIIKGYTLVYLYCNVYNFSNVFLTDTWK